MEEFEVQVATSHYDWSKYVNPYNWKSYYQQIEEITKLDAEKILIIGKGDGIVPAILTNLGMDVTTFDFDASIKPDIVGDVRYMDRYISKGQFDTVLCCQVLEHIPFENFENVLKSLKELGIRNIILSLPNYSRDVKIDLKFELLRKTCKRLRLVNLKAVGDEPRCKGQHYWEINVKGTELPVVREAISRQYRIKREFYVFENEYHMFFILEA